MCRPASVSCQALHVGSEDGVFLPVGPPLAGVRGTVTAPSLCLGGCSTVSGEDCCGEDRCGGLQEQLSEETSEAPDVVCRISLCSEVQRASLLRPVSREESSPPAWHPGLRRQLRPPQHVAFCCPRCRPSSGLAGRGEGPARACGACVHTGHRGESVARAAEGRVN